MKSAQLCLVVALGATALTATTASAATVSRSGTTITYQAAAGEENHIEVHADANGSMLFEEGTHLGLGALPYTTTPGDGCMAGDPTITTCDAAGATLLVLKLGDMRDELSTVQQPMAFDLPSGMKLKVDGGPGNDDLIGTAGSDVLDGGTGNDDIFGSGGTDTMDGGAGSDGLSGFGTLRGGAGNDHMVLGYGSGSFKSYASHAYGGSGNDSFASGNGKHDTIDCGSGKHDVVAWGTHKGEDKLKHCERHVP